MITKHSSALYIGMAKVLPIIDVLGCDGQNSSFSSSPPSSSRSDSTPITQKGSHYINMKLCGYVGFCNGKRLVILTCLQTTLFTSKQQQIPQAIHYKGRYVAL